MELLVNDARFTLYNVCYKRVLVCWITVAFLVLLTLLFSGLEGLTLFSLGVLWLILNAMAIFLCMWIKLRLFKGLEQCLASVNKLLTKHKLILALDDRGKLSCHKVNLFRPCTLHCPFATIHRKWRGENNNARLGTKIGCIGQRYCYSRQPVYTIVKKTGA